MEGKAASLQSGAKCQSPGCWEGVDGECQLPGDRQSHGSPFAGEGGVPPAQCPACASPGWQWQRPALWQPPSAPALPQAPACPFAQLQPLLLLLWPPGWVSPFLLLVLGPLTVDGGRGELGGHQC